MSFGHSMSLKNGVDIQLQSAFGSENWPTVVRLAEKRAKSGSDAFYYEAVKVCAESRLDGVTEKAAVVLTVDRWVRQGTVPGDVESLDLLEWAAGLDGRSKAAVLFPFAYSESFGVLRLRWAKANTKDMAGLMASVKQCLLSWDLVNAQQIAAILDRSFHATDRRFMYWNILLTHMLSTSLQCPESKRKIYGMLAQKQLEKAADMAASTTEANKDRALQHEEEFLLYYRVLAQQASAEDFLQRAARDAHNGALEQLRRGRKQPFLDVVAHLEAAGQWAAVFDLCREALQMRSEAGLPLTLACDLRVWRSFVAASEKQTDVEGAFDTVQSILQSFIAARAELPPLFTKTIGMALLEVTFHLPSSLVAAEKRQGGEEEPSARVAQLLLYIKANLDKVAVFGDIKSFVEQLTFAEAQDLLQRLRSSSADNAYEAQEVHQAVLVYQLRYLLATCPQTLWNQADPDGGSSAVLTCKFCSRPSRPASFGCAPCFADMSRESLAFHRQLTDDVTFIQTVLPRLDKDPRVALALVAASSLLQLADSTDRGGQKKRQLGTRGEQGRFFLQAVAVLDHQLAHTPGDDIPLRLLLVRLHLRLGDAARALELWQPLGVKRTILDALGPLFFDRLSTVAPPAGLLRIASSSSSSSGTDSFAPALPLTDGLRTYYDTVLRRPSPVKIWDAFDAASYSSILDMAQLHDHLGRSATRAMALLEERRAARAVGGRLEDVEELAIFYDISNDTEFVTVTDYGSMPNLNSSLVPSLAESLSLGPGLSNNRMHLGLLAEKYLDLVSFKPPKEYKPARPSEAAQRERAHLLESLAAVESSLMDFLHHPDTPAQLTAAELTYYSAVSLLSSFAVASLTTSPASPAPPYLASIPASLTALCDLARLSTDVPTDREAEAMLESMAHLHGLSLFRDLAVALRQTSAFLAAHHDRESTRDRTGKSGLHKGVLAETKTLKTLSTQAFVDIKGRFKAAKDALANSSIQMGLAKWVAGGAESGSQELSEAVLGVLGGKEAVEDWAGRVAGGWRRAVQGWSSVQLD